MQNTNVFGFNFGEHTSYQSYGVQKHNFRQYVQNPYLRIPQTTQQFSQPLSYGGQGPNLPKLEPTQQHIRLPLHLGHPAQTPAEGLLNAQCSQFPALPQPQRLVHPRLYARYQTLQDQSLLNVHQHWQPHHRLPLRQIPTSPPQLYIPPASSLNPPVQYHHQLERYAERPPLPTVPQVEQEIINISDDEEVEVEVEAEAEVEVEVESEFESEVTHKTQANTPTSTTPEAAVPRKRRSNPEWLKSTAPMGLQTALSPELLANYDMFTAVRDSIQVAKLEQQRLCTKREMEKKQREREARARALRKKKDEEKARKLEQRREVAKRRRKQKLEEKAKPSQENSISKKRKIECEGKTSIATPALQEARNFPQGPPVQPFESIDMEQALWDVLCDEEEDGECEPIASVLAVTPTIDTSNEMDAELDLELFGDGESPSPEEWAGALPVPVEDEESEVSEEE